MLTAREMQECGVVVRHPRASEVCLEERRGRQARRGHAEEARGESRRQER